LTGYASDEWHRVAPALHAAGLLCAADVAVLAIYCASYQHWREAGEILAEEGIVQGNRPHPAVKLESEFGAMMVRCASQLGLTPAGRLRITGSPHWPGPEPRSKFDGLLA
jgi:P27 family predicted phage terminase small subunit